MENQYKLRLEKIEGVLQSWLPENPDSFWLEKIFMIPGGAIHPGLLKALSLPGWDLVNRGGKRWRPLLMYLIAEALAGEQGAATALPLTPMVEFPHNASLIHDDIEDNSDERRGKPAVHLIYGNDVAINSGAFLYFLPMACLYGSDFPEGTKNRLRETWEIYMRRLHLGQAMDISWHNNNSSLPEIPDYEKMCGLKTGCLARMAAVLAIQCAGHCLEYKEKPPLRDLEERLGRAAEKLGVGFQILDDVKNLRGGIPGKKRGDDIVEGKKSLPVLLFLERYPEKRKFSADCFRAARSKGIAAPELEEFISALESAGVLDEAGKRGTGLILESRELFTGTQFRDTHARDLLGGLIDFISS